MVGEANPLDLVALSALMDTTEGRSDILIGLVDGPVALDHPDLRAATVRLGSPACAVSCRLTNSLACRHGTHIAGILSARRGVGVPAICPGCTLVVRPIFSETDAVTLSMPTASPQELSAAIEDCIHAGARIINLSLALSRTGDVPRGELRAALDLAAGQGRIVVAAAGNLAQIGGSELTRHPWVLPVVACDRHGRVLGSSNLGHAAARQGLLAPGERIRSLHSAGGHALLSGTSAAAAFVTGAAALLWSLFPSARAEDLRFALNRANRKRPATLTPPLLDGAGAYGFLSARYPIATRFVA